MSKQIISSYSFNAAARTITLNDFDGSHPVRLERLALITDTTTNKVLYNFADSSLATATVSSNNVITLSVLQGGEANGDKLRIDYDTVAGDPEYSAATNISATGLALDATLTGGTQQTQITDGTNAVNVLKSDGTAAGQNAQFVAGAHLSVPFSTTTAQTVAVTDAANYSWVSVQIATQGTSSVVSYQVSNDGTNWVSTALMTLTGSSAVTTTSLLVTCHGPLSARYFRLNITGITAGTTSGVIEFFTQPKGHLTSNVNAIQNGTWTVQPGNTANTTPWLMTPHNGTNAALFVDDSTGSVSPSSTANKQAVVNRNTVFWSSGNTWERMRQVENGMNTGGAGVLAAGIVGQYDDASPNAVGENNFGTVRMSANRNLYGTIRDAAGNERGANVTAANALVVDASATTQPVNMTQVAGAAASVNAGTNDAGTQRVTQATAATLFNGRRTVTTAGTRVALASSQALTQGVTVKALAGNTGTIYVGDSAVSAANGFALDAGETVTLPISNLATAFIDASVSGEGVTYIGV